MGLALYIESKTIFDDVHKMIWIRPAWRFCYVVLWECLDQASLNVVLGSIMGIFGSGQPECCVR